MSKSNEDLYLRMRDAVDWSIRNMETIRANRLKAIKEYVGYHYSDNGSSKRVPVNLIELAVTIYIRLLAARAPHCLVTTQLAMLRPFAANLELFINQIPDEIGLSTTMRRAVLDAIFGLGIVKVGVASEGKMAEGVPYSEPFVDIVQLDDYFVDMSARSWKEIDFEGNSYWMSINEAREVFNNPELQADEDSGSSDSNAEAAHTISVDETATVVYDRIRLRDVYMHKTGRIITYSVTSGQVLRDEPWDGPEGSPYVKLFFEEVPGNLMPLAPVTVWQDLHDLGNALFRKLGREADSKKTVYAFRGGNDDDVDRFKRAKDGEGIRFDGAQPEALTVGGVDQTTLAFFLQVRDTYNIMAGNLDSLGGLSPQAGTATQDKLLNEAASSRIRSMAEATTDFAKEIFKRLAWYLWTDPVRSSRALKMADEGLGLGVAVEWTPEARDGDFLDYNFDIDVFSMQDDTPNFRVERFATIFERFIMPLSQHMEMQGAQLNIKEIIEFLAKNTNTPELLNFVSFPEPYVTQMRQPIGNQSPDYVSSKPSYTKRVYERVNRPGASRAGKDYALSQLLMGGKPQQDEAATIGRSIQ